ncbi:MAG: SGNH/GDSL hydrolase family protein [Myxococcota bacterium]
MLGPPPDCAVPDIAEFVYDAAQDVVLRLVDPETGEFSYRLARVDPDLAPGDVAVGGTHVAELLDGPTELATTILAHLVYDPDGGLADPPPYAQIELVEAASPTIVLSTDLLGNDVINAILMGERIDPAAVTPYEEVEPDLREALARLAGTGAEVFVANLPRPSTLPATAERKRAEVEAGTATEAEVDARIAEIDAAGERLNALLADEAAAYPNVHVVDLYAHTADVAANGMEVGGEQLHSGKLGGLLSLDGVHFSDVGYAAVGALFVRAINAELGTEVPEPDLAAIMETDPYALAALREAGIEPDDCQ